MTRAIIYTRRSPAPNQEELTSCETQAMRCRTYCDRKGYDVADTIMDKATSGGDVSRAGLQEAMEKLSAGDILVVDRPDRLARDSLIFLTIRGSVEALGATVEFADGTLPADTAEGRLMQSILAAFAAYERDRIRERTKAGLARKKKAGMHLGRCPIGYKRGKGGKLVRNEEEWKQIQAILSLNARGLDTKNIVDSCRMAGERIRGKPWTSRLVRRILEREKGSEQTSGYVKLI